MRAFEYKASFLDAYQKNETLTPPNDKYFDHLARVKSLDE